MRASSPPGLVPLSDGDQLSACTPYGRRLGRPVPSASDSVHASGATPACAILARHVHPLGRRAGRLPGARGQGLPERGRSDAHAATRARGRVGLLPRARGRAATSAGTSGSSGARRRAQPSRASSAPSRDEIAFVPNTSTGINLIADLLEGDGAVLTRRARVPDRHAAVDPPRRPVRFVEPRSRASLRLESLRRRPGAARGDDRDQPRAVLERLPPGPATPSAAMKGTPASRRLREPVGRAPSRSTSAAAASTRWRQRGHKWLCAGYGAGFLLRQPGAARAGPPRAIGWMSVEDPFAFDNRHLSAPARRQRAYRDGMPVVRADLRARGGRGIPARHRHGRDRRAGADAEHVPHRRASPRVVRRCSRRAVRTAPAKRWCACRSPSGRGRISSSAAST